MNQSMNPFEEIDLWAEPTLTELIDNNKHILENKIKLKTICFFVDILVLSEKHEKYVKLLRALVNCDGEPIVRNQDQVTKLILGDYYTLDSLLYKI